MCQSCVDHLQETMDEAAAKVPPERLVVHLDSDDDPSVPHGDPLDREQVEAGLHESMNEQCWCQPIIIETFDTRTAAEIHADYVSRGVQEVVT